MSLSIGFFGSPTHAAELLELLLNDGFNIKFVVTNQDKPFGRKQILTPTPVKVLAESKQIPVITSPKLREDESAKQSIFSFNADIHIVYAYGSIISDDVFLFPKFKSINLHGSILPLLRGASPVQSAIRLGFELSGFTIQYLASQVDSGDILLTKEIPIEEDDNTETYLKKITGEGYLALKALLKTEPSSWQKHPQDHEKATHCKKIKNEDRILDFHSTAQNLHNQIRALNPDPLAFCQFRGKRLILRKSYLPKNGERAPDGFVQGQLLVLDKKKLFCVAGDLNLLGLEELQLEGKNPVSAKDFINGMRLLDEEGLN